MARTLDDIPRLYQWCKDHRKEAYAIGQRGRVLAQSLDYVTVTRDFARALLSRLGFTRAQRRPVRVASRRDLRVGRI